MRIELTFAGEPVGQKRPRYTSQGGGRVYDPSASVKRKMQLQAIAQMREKGFKMLSEGIIGVEVYAYSTPPRSWPQKRLKCVSENKPFKITKPDIDNVAKLALDMLNGIAYSDDRFIARLVCEKRYSDRPRIDIVIEELS